MAIWNLRDIWRIDITTSKKLHQFALAVGAFGSLDTILAALNRVPIAKLAVDLPLFNRTARSGVVDAVSF
jgi:hypothetical protein